MSVEAAAKPTAEVPVKAVAAAQPASTQPKPVVSGIPRTPMPVLVVAYARVVPFVACAFVVVLTPPAASAFAVEIAYGAVLLSFLGGARWGAAMTRGGGTLSFKPLALTMLPTFFSWFILFMPRPTALAALMAGFLLVAMAERADERADRVPQWRKGLDLPLTILTELALGISLFCAISS